MIREELPIVSTAMLIGDKRKFLSVLLTLKSDINLETGAPLDKLTRISRDWCVVRFFNCTFFRNGQGGKQTARQTARLAVI